MSIQFKEHTCHMNAIDLQLRLRVTAQRCSLFMLLDKQIGIRVRVWGRIRDRDRDKARVRNWTLGFGLEIVKGLDRFMLLLARHFLGFLVTIGRNTHSQRGLWTLSRRSYWRQGQPCVLLSRIVSHTSC